MSKPIRLTFSMLQFKLWFFGSMLAGAVGGFALAILLILGGIV